MTVLFSIVPSTFRINHKSLVVYDSWYGISAPLLLKNETLHLNDDPSITVVIEINSKN